MLTQQLTRIVFTENRDVLSSVVIHEEGMALVEVIESGVTKVQLSTGAANEVFAGVSLSRNAPPSVVPNVEQGMVPAGLQVTTARVPVVGQLLVKVGGVSRAVVTTAPTTAQVQVVGNVITFNAADASAALFIQYQYQPTVQEARTFLGDLPIGGLASTSQSNIGAIVHGVYGTNMFDASVDWSTVLHPNLGPNGTFTVGGTGTLLTNVVVRTRPSSDSSWLVLAAAG